MGTEALRLQGEGERSKASRAGSWPTTRIAGTSGLLMVAAIVVNGPVSMLAGRMPDPWAGNAASELRAYLTDPSSLRTALIFFFLSCFIFVFGIPFFAGIRLLAGQADPSGLVGGVVAIGSALFLAGGLVSEISGAGMPLVMQSVPGWHLDVNSALLVGGLWFVSLSQAQVALGTVMIVFSAASLRSRVLPPWIAWLGVGAGLIDLARPLLIAHPGAFVGLFQPSLLWLTLVALVLLRMRASFPDQSEP